MPPAPAAPTAAADNGEGKDGEDVLDMELDADADAADETEDAALRSFKFVLDMK